MSGTTPTSFPSTLPSPPTTNDIASRILSMMTALNGQATDYNAGSQLRTFSESAGAVIEMESVAAQQQAYVGFTYGSISAFGITPETAQPASGLLIFSTASAGTPPPATQNVIIPDGTIVQTSSGIQFQTINALTIYIGAISGSVTGQAIVGGTAGNVAAGTVNNIITSIGYPLNVTNPNNMTGGSAAETASQTLARFAAKAASLGLSSPVAIANGVVGMTDGSETVRFGAVFEPWLADISDNAGFNVFIDDGNGGASQSLINQVTANLTGNASTGATGFRPAGVPFSVSGVIPINATVQVTGTVLPVVQPSVVSAGVQTAIDEYFSGLGFGASALQPQIAAQAANAGLGYFQSLSVLLYYSSGGAAQPFIPAGPQNRVILETIIVQVTATATT